MTKPLVNKTRQVPGKRLICPICDRDVGFGTGGSITAHNPLHPEWKWTPWCSGGGLTEVAAEAVRANIKMLVKEARLLRQVEKGARITKPYPPGSLVGATKEKLHDDEITARASAIGVEHSVNLLRGEPPFGEDDE